MEKKEGKGRRPTFEEALKRLEEIVSALESGERPLEESLRLFEEGTKLSRQAAEQLQRAEQKIELLKKDEQGAVTGSETIDDLPGGEEGGAAGTPA